MLSEESKQLDKELDKIIKEAEYEKRAERGKLS